MFSNCNFMTSAQLKTAQDSELGSRLKTCSRRPKTQNSAEDSELGVLETQDSRPIAHELAHDSRTWAATSAICGSTPHLCSRSSAASTHFANLKSSKSWERKLLSPARHKYMETSSGRASRKPIAAMNWGTESMLSFVLRNA